MTTLVNDLENTAELFVKNMGNPLVSTKHFQTLVNSCVGQRDTNHLSRSIERLIKKGDTKGAATVRAIISTIWNGATIVTDAKSKRLTIKISGVDADQSALDRFNTAINEKKLTLRSTLLSATRGEVAKKSLDERAAKFVEDNSHDKIVAEIARLREYAKKIEEAAKVAKK